MREIHGAATAAHSEAGRLAGRQLSLSLGTKSNTELRRIVLENTHDQALLGVVHSVLSDRRDEEAANLRVEIRRLRGLATANVRSVPTKPIWTYAAEPRRRWHIRWPYLLLGFGFVAIGFLSGLSL